LAPGASSAIVVGASMAGLLAARALSKYYAQVFLVERDPLPPEAATRKGVPQGAHAHGLLASGYRVIDAYCPGLMDDLRAAGAPFGDVTGNFLWFQFGRWKLRHDCGLRGVTVSRPCLETAVRERVRMLPNVTVLEGTACTTPTYDARTGRVTGTVIRRDGGKQETLAADLVVDATGRGSQSPKWLREWGFDEPATATVKVDVGYATRIFERRPGDFYDTMGGIIADAPPGGTRLGAVLAAEDDHWLVTLGGSIGDYPPDDEDGWVRFAASLPHPVVHQLVTTARPLSAIAVYRFPANHRRMYERMKRFPDGYLVIGDAICSFNPIYGQGMSVAAMEAQALDETLAGGLDNLARRFFARTRKIVDIPWTIATGEDLRYPQIEGARPPGSTVVNRYLERVHAVASHDPFVCRKFFDVLNLLAPPTSLFAPAVLLRVLTAQIPEGSGSPLGAGSAQGAAV